MPITNLRIRRATEDDALLIAKLGARMFKEAFAQDNEPEDMDSYLAQNFSLEKIEAEFAAPSSIFLLAYEDEKPIGYAKLKAGKIPRSVSGPKPVELVRVYVDQKIIGKGYGSVLMKSCIGQAKLAKYKTIWLGVWEKNEGAIKFYEKWGFSTVGSQVFILGSDIQNDLVMQRPVDT
jgi:GNAT superfamily N-acetyltransferase